jgi:eukaryotic-like serine/threonine-protein kinase
MACLAPELLTDFADGRLGSAQLEAVDAHLDGCPSCRQLIGRYAGDLSTEGAQDPGVPDPLIRRGTTLGRYVVLGLRGAGGMGAVYTAFDPQLDRKVALKLLRPRAPSDAGGDAVESPNFFEARAMARVSHPNVVSVFDVGTIDGRSFIAMELVEGESLRKWLEDAPRSWREVRDAFVGAARGLQAAHAANVVHRDFKPENVLIGSDGRSRVTDFGLSSALGPTGELHAAGASGTIGYSAPEQREGRPVDARADQFSFCVALFEALYGVRPFAGTSSTETRSPVLLGKVRTSRFGPIPHSVHSAVVRGLSLRPEERFRSMDELIAALLVDPARTRRRTLALAAVTTVALSVTVGFARLVPREPPCRGTARHLAGLWDDGARSAVRAAFLGTGRPFAEDAWRAVDSGLGDFVARWGIMRTEACEATRVRGDQSDEVLSLRMACLDRRLLEARALVDLLRHAGPTALEGATEATHRLGVLAGCADTAALLAPFRAPPLLTGQVNRARDELASARALVGAGQVKEARGEADRLVQVAQRLKYRPLEAESLLFRGQLESKRGDAQAAVSTLHDAALAAEAAGDVTLETQAYLELARACVLQGQSDSAVLYAAHAAVGLERLGPNPEFEGRHALALAEAAVTSHYKTEQPEVTLTWVATAKRLLERALGPKSLSVASALSLEGTVLTDLGRYREAIEAHQRAVELVIQIHGPRHPETSRKLHNLADSLFLAGEIGPALENERRALAIRIAALGPEHPLTTWSETVIGSFLLESAPEEALLQLQHSVPRVEQAYGPPHPRTAIAFVLLGDALLKVKRGKEALVAHGKALALIESNKGSPTDAALALMGLGLDRLALNEAKQAVGDLERAVGLLGDGKVFAPEAARARLGLAKALWASGGDRMRARTLAEEAREALLKGSPLSRPLLDEAVVWLASRPTVVPLGTIR